MFLKFKTVILTSFVFISFSSLMIIKTKSDCDDVISYGEDAYRYFKKAYNSNSKSDAQWYVKKGMNEASYAEDDAGDSDCDCDDAESAAADAYSYGKKAYNSNRLDDLRYYTKKAMNSSLEIVDEAEDCEDE